MRFEAISRLRINLEISELIPIGGVTNVKELVVVLGCKVGRLPSTYLSLLSGAWDVVEERFQGRLVI